jgi:uncharacterized membrane protein YhaH (DUF805 family)
MFSGRIDRVGYFLGAVYTLMPIIVFLLLYIFSAAFFGTEGNVLRSSVNVVLFFFGSIYSLLLLPVTIGLTIRRWHDLNETGWLTLLNFIPVVSSIIGLVLLFVRGTAGPNNHGEPLHMRSLTEVLFGKKPVAESAPPAEPPLPGTFGAGKM